MSDYPTFPPPSSPPPRVGGEVRPEDTQRLPLAPPAVPPRRGRRGFAAAVVTASLLVGGAAGIGGAATYSALTDDSGTTGGRSTATSSTVATSPDRSAPEGSVEEVAAAVLPSVVKLDVSGAEGQGSGSGAILSSDGQILTNEHVAALAGEGGEITVSFTDGTKATATVLGSDPLTTSARRSWRSGRRSASTRP
jgi:putative serine protease PepD